MRYSLRTFLLGAVLISAPIAIFIGRVDTQRRTVTKLRARGIDVVYSDEVAILGSLSSLGGPIDRSYVHDCRNCVAEVCLNANAYDAAVGRDLQRLPYLTRIYLHGLDSNSIAETIASEFPSVEIIDVDLEYQSILQYHW